MRIFLAAVKYLTIVPWPRGYSATAEQLGRSASWFPLVGLCLGLILVFLDRLLDPYLASEILSVVLVTVPILLTRALPLERLGESWDRLSVRGDAEDSVSRSRDRGVGIFGLLAVVVVIALKFRAIEVMGEARGPGLLLAPVLGRWAMVVLAYGSTPLSAGENQTLMEHVRGKQLVLATTITLVVVSLFARRLGLLIALWVSLLALLSRQFLHRRLGGVSEDHLGAIGEMSEALALVLFATL